MENEKAGPANVELIREMFVKEYLAKWTDSGLQEICDRFNKCWRDGEMDVKPVAYSIVDYRDAIAFYFEGFIGGVEMARGRQPRDENCSTGRNFIVTELVVEKFVDEGELFFTFRNWVIKNKATPKTIVFLSSYEYDKFIRECGYLMHAGEDGDYFQGMKVELRVAQY